MKQPVFLAVLLMPFAAYAGEPIMPTIPDEAIKIRALKLGYVLNGGSMVRAPHLGSLDVSGLLYETPPPLKLAPPPVARGGDK